MPVDNAPVGVGLPGSVRRLIVPLLAAGLLASVAGARGGGAPGTIVVSADRSSEVSGEIYRVDLDGRRTDLSRSPFQDTDPFVSPDGKQVAFLSDRTGRQALYVVGSDGRGLTHISPSLPQALVPQPSGWLPDSRRFLVVTTSQQGVNGTPSTVLWAFAKGQAPLALERAEGLDVIAEPTPSPDGRVVAFRENTAVTLATTTGRRVFSSSWQLSGADRLAWSAQNRLAVAAGSTVRILDESGRRLASFPAQAFAWSPRGDRLADVRGGVLEVRGDGGGGRLVLAQRLFAASKVRAITKSFGTYAPELVWDGENRVLVGNVQLGSQASGPAPNSGAQVNVGVDVSTGKRWQPRERIWFVSTCGCVSLDGSLAADTVKSGSAFALQAFRATGGAARRVEGISGCRDDGGFVAAIGPLQFAAGRSIVYQSTCYEPAANLYTVAPDGSGLRRLTRTTSQQTDPAWSPSGTQIAYSQADATGLSCKGCPATVWVSNADGTGARALTTALPSDSTWDTSPSWSPDGSRIVFSHSTLDSSGELFVVPVAGGVPTDLHLKGTSPAWGPKRIAYIGNADLGGARLTLRTVAPDGSGLRVLAFGAVASPAWSPSGELAALDRHLAHASGRGRERHDETRSASVRAGGDPGLVAGWDAAAGHCATRGHGAVRRLLGAARRQWRATAHDRPRRPRGVLRRTLFARS